MPCRPLFTNGSAVFRRNKTHLQIGTNPGWVVNDQPGLLQLLQKIDGGTEVAQLQRECGDHIDVASIITELIGAGIVVDTARWKGGPSREHQAGLARGLEPSEVHRRSRYRVAITHDSGTSMLAATMHHLLNDAEVARAASDTCELIINCSTGEPDRALFAAAAHRGIDQLPVVFDGSTVRCGPYTRPGRWPCLTCHDQLRKDWDPSWPALLYQRRTTPPGGVAIAATLMRIVAAHIGDDVISAAENRVPSTFSCTRIYGPGIKDSARHPVPFHPECACTRLLADAS